MLHTFPPAFFTVTSYSCKVNTMVFVILLQVHKVNFVNRQQILIFQVKASKLTYNVFGGTLNIDHSTNEKLCNKCNLMYRKGGKRTSGYECD